MTPEWASAWVACGILSKKSDMQNNSLFGSNIASVILSSETVMRYFQEMIVRWLRSFLDVVGLISRSPRTIARNSSQ
jgi:hypothetical protein